jgi:transposase
MKRRKIDPEVKMAAFLEASGRESTLTEICRKYQISETLFYRGRDKFLEAGKQDLTDRNGTETNAAAIRHCSGNEPKKS